MENNNQQQQNENESCVHARNVDANQVVINKNHGTIHIHNNNKTNEDINRICDKLENVFKDFRENFEISKTKKKK